MNVLEAKGLEKSFGDLKAVNGATFHIAPGETYGLLGPNGAGKTTAISMIAGLLEIDGGEVLINRRGDPPEQWLPRLSGTGAPGPGHLSRPRPPRI